MQEQENIELPLLPKENKGHVNLSINPQLDHSNEGPSGRYEPRPPLLQYVTFTDIYPHCKRLGQATHEVDISELPKPELSYNVEFKALELEANWKKQLQKKNPSFMNALLLTFVKEITFSFIVILIDQSTKIYYSVYVGNIVSIFSDDALSSSEKSDKLIFSASMLTALVVVSLFAKNWAIFFVHTNLERARLAITCLLYKKLHSTSLTSLHEIKLGKVINLIANDLNDMTTLQTIAQMAVNPLLIVLSTYMMWGYFGPSALIGMGCLILAISAQVYLSNKTHEPRKENKKSTDERVKFTHEVIEGIRLIKMYTWERLFQKKILELRTQEEKTFIKMNIIDAMSRNLSSTSIYANILLVCIVYVLLGNTLSPDKIYASMMLLLYLGTNLVLSNTARMGLVNFRIVVERVESVLNVKNITAEEEYKTLDSSSELEPVSFENFTGYWKHDATKPCLSNINLVFHPGTVTSIIGKIGSGKSTLLLSFLKELPVTRGKLSYSGKIAYVEQDPVIFSGTVRDNILFGRAYNPSLYKKVIQDCNLERDLELLTHGDSTLIGERGVNLSGGQKARICLGRALYSQSDIYLLDDPFSALDSKVSRDIFNKVLKGSLKKKTVILVTHHLHFAKESDHVVLMDEGKVEIQGTFSELERSNNSLLQVFKIENQKKMSEEVEKRLSKHEKKKETGDDIFQKKEKAVKEESIVVTWQTYKDYLQVQGHWGKFLQIAVLFLFPHILTVVFTTFLGYWAEAQEQFYRDRPIDSEEEFSNVYHITLSISMLLLILVVGHFKTIKTYQFLLMTNTEIHRRMLAALLRAKTVFFDLNPVGRVLNRFSNDLGVLDKGNTKLIFECMDHIIGNFSLLITVCLINPGFILPCVFAFYGLYRIRRFFEKPSVLSKKLDLISKSPMVSAVPATLQGLTIIRVYNQGARFIKEFLDLVYNNTKAITFLMKTTRLFIVALEAPIQCLTLSGVWIFIVVIMYYDLNAGLLGMSLMYLMKIGSHGTVMLRITLDVDVNMQSAQRVMDYCKLENEAPEEIPEVDRKVESEFRGDWPTKGEIEFSQVSMKYRKDLGFALSDFSLKVPGGLKIACIGRTGAGKSSVIQALFRMTEIENGAEYKESFIKIDGVDIGKIGLRLLRSKISIIPQTPVIFTGTIKRNLDPFGKLSNEELWDVLEEVGLKKHVAALQDQLETDMTVSATVFSTGQKQLMCLARAILSKSRVIILDEATANVDVETDSIIQKTIMEKFRDCTVLTVAHRLITIANYDKVVVVDKGSVAEFDSPYRLLVEQIGDREITNKRSQFAEMVKSTGASMAKTIFEVAREHYNQTNSSH